MRIMLAAGLLGCAAAIAVSAEAPPRGHGSSTHPSIEGNWRVNFIIPMEATPATPQLVVSESDAKAVAATAGAALADEFAKTLDPELPMMVTQSDGLAIVRGQRRTRAVVLPVDGMLPYTTAARKELSAPPPSIPADNPEQRPNAERCLVGSGQPPLSSFALDSQIQIIRTRDQVVIHSEYGDDVRVVPLSKAHGPKVFWSRLGDSIGHWEGETLVIETTNFTDRTSISENGNGLRHSDALRLIERVTRVAVDIIDYRVTIEDPKTYIRPWTLVLSLTSPRGYELLPYDCHEGNYGLPNILKGERAEDRALEADARRGVYRERRRLLTNPNTPAAEGSER